MAERLPRKTYVDIAHSIWRVAQVGIPVALERAKPPCVVTKMFNFDSQYLDLSLELTRNPVTDQSEPTIMEAKLTESEPHSMYADYLFYSYKSLLLDLRTFTKKYETGTYEWGVEEDAGITPITSGPLARDTTLLSQTQWQRTARTLGINTRFGPEQADYFLTNLANFTERIRQDQ